MHRVKNFFQVYIHQEKPNGLWLVIDLLAKIFVAQYLDTHSNFYYDADGGEVNARTEYQQRSYSRSY